VKLTITGICGFVGSRLARHLLERMAGLDICGIDNLSRAGSEYNRRALEEAGIRVIHGDLRMPSDVDALPAADWVIDAAANPSVLAGVDGRTSLRQLIEHNLGGTLNLVEYCAKYRAGLVLLSTSRVYSIEPLASLKVNPVNEAFAPDPSQLFPPSLTEAGISEQFSVAPPLSPYGASKLASEIVALEYGAACGFPVWIDRCGVLAGAGQFGTAEQGIFSYWLSAYAARRPLRYIGFGGHGWQVRDACHPADLAELIVMQMARGDSGADRTYNVGGGPTHAMSLAQLTAWCERRFGRHVPCPDPHSRRFDVPWLVMDASAARRAFGWVPARSLDSILEEIARHVRDNPDWLARCGVT